MLGTVERLGIGLSHGCHPQDMSELETDDLKTEQIFTVVLYCVHNVTNKTFFFFKDTQNVVKSSMMSCCYLKP